MKNLLLSAALFTASACMGQHVYSISGTAPAAADGDTVTITKIDDHKNKRQSTGNRRQDHGYCRKIHLQRHG